MPRRLRSPLSGNQEEEGELPAPGRLESNPRRRHNKSRIKSRTTKKECHPRKLGSPLFPPHPPPGRPIRRRQRGKVRKGEGEKGNRASNEAPIMTGSAQHYQTCNIIYLMTADVALSIHTIHLAEALMCVSQPHEYFQAN